MVSTELVRLQDLDIRPMYHDLLAGQSIYRIRSMVCYYGQHYIAFARKKEKWLMFDDATVHPIGTWSQVVGKCEAGRTQPSVLFYEST